MRLADDLDVPRLALGCWAFAGGPEWGHQDERESRCTIHAALDSGINFFDTAPAYGDGVSEEVLGRALKGLREEAIIASKVSPALMGRTELIKSCEDSLRRLRTDRIDLLQLHWPSRDVPFGETVAALLDLRQAGKIRHVGVCNFSVLDLQDMLATGIPVLTNQVPYSLLSRSIEYEILPACRERKVGVLAYSPLMQGLLTGKYRDADSVPDGRARSRHFSGDRPLARHGEPGCEEATFAALQEIFVLAQSAHVSVSHLALAWLLVQPGVTSLIVGARNPQQFQENLKVLDLVLPPSLLSELDQATASVKEHLGRNPDLWNAESRYRL